MGYIVLEGWDICLDKILLSKLQREILGLRLKESKENVDKILEKEKVWIKINNHELAKKFIEEARKTGATCYFLPDDPSSLSDLSSHKNE